MKLHFIEEPELQFGSSKHIDIKFGILNHGVLDFDKQEAPRKINLGVIGSNETVEKFLGWVDECRNVVQAKKSNKQNLFPHFPGFASDHSFYSEILCNQNFQRRIGNADISRIEGLNSQTDRVNAAAELLLDEIGYLAENNLGINVIVCALPLQFLKMVEVDAASEDEGEQEDEEEAAKMPKLDLRKLLKAKALKYRIPLQIVLPSTYDESVKRRVKINPDAEGSLQDKATRAWNFFTALYYKAGGTPWRMIRHAEDYQSCFIGVSFYRSLDEETVQTSVAQVFNERGEGMIVRGGYAKTSKDDRQLHLGEEDMKSLVSNSLTKYRKEHKTLPARVVIYKSSDYDQDEINGITAAIRQENVEMFDLLSLSKSFLRLNRIGKYPPLRGTLWQLEDEQSILYTKGSVDFYQTYPGMYVPKTLKLKTHYSDQTTLTLAREILALTKMNWNNTQFDNSWPITIKAARQVGDILKYVSADGYVEPRYSFYM